MICQSITLNYPPFTIHKVIAVSLCVTQYDIFWRPVREVRTAANPEPFVTAHPKDIIRSGDFNRVPFVLGSNSDEGGFFLLREFRVKRAAYMGATYTLKSLCREI
jgi:carboxylesterase type B